MHPVYEWRGKAHKEFDLYWLLGRCTRPQAYRVLMKVMRMTRDEAHIKLFSTTQCKYLISAIENGAFDLIMDDMMQEILSMYPARK